MNHEQAKAAGLPAGYEFKGSGGTGVPAYQPNPGICLACDGTGQDQGVRRVLVLILNCGPSHAGQERRALVAIDCESGGPAGCERYAHPDDGANALARLMVREGWGEGNIVMGPELTVPARELFRLVSGATGRARRARLEEKP